MAASSVVSIKPTVLPPLWSTWSSKVFHASKTRLASKASWSAFTNERRSLLQIFGHVLKGKAMGSFMTLIPLQCLPVENSTRRGLPLITLIRVDYRIPQMLHSLGCLQYSPSLEYHIRQLLPIESGHSWEVQLRGKLGIRLSSNSSTLHLSSSNYLFLAFKISLFLYPVFSPSYPNLP